MHSTGSNKPNNISDDNSLMKTHDTSKPAANTSFDVWYHGELNEHDANHLLQGTTPGAFLVRQTGPTRYYLSVQDHDGLPKHIPIRQLTSPHYFFEGKRYETLRDIVEFYKPAVFPIRKGGIMPSNGEIIESKYLCLRSFERRESDEMCAEIGDVLTVCETDEPGWMLGRNETNGSVGIVLKSHLEPLICPVDELTDLPYFYDTVSSDMVQFDPIGTFLLRRSSKGTDTYALLVKTQFDLVEKFLIVGSPSRGFSLAGRPFPTIGHILARYCDRAISGGVRLTHAACVKRKPSSRLEIRWPENKMSSSQYDDVYKNKQEKTRQIFRGTSIDTALASSHFLTASASTSMPSPANTISTGIAEHLLDRLHDEEVSDHVNTSSTTVASTVALRKSREEKQWKECWVTLSDIPGGSSQITVFDSMGSKLRQQLDLSTCTMFWLDESVFSTDGCLYLSSSSPSNPTLYLCFRPFTTFLKWVRMLRSRTIYQDVPPPMLQNAISIGEPNSQVSFLSIEIEKFRSDILKSDALYSANVSLNGVRVGTSNSFTPAGNKGPNELPTVVIDSKFVIPCIPTCSTNIQLSIMSHSSAGKKGRPCGVQVTACLNESNESVFQQSVESSGFVFRAQRRRCPVLPLDRYQPMLEMIRESPTNLLSWPSQVLPAHFKQFMYSCISHLYAINPHFMSPVVRKVVSEVLVTSTPEDVFRKDSLATGIITQCLRHLFKTPFDEFLLENSQFTQIISKSSSSLDSGVELLVNFVDQRLLTIPLATRLLTIAAECARNRFGEEDAHLVKRTLSALLILRVLNPIIFSTLNSGVGSQIAKIVQISANSAASQTPVESLTPAAATIRRMFERMIILVDQQSPEPEEASPDDLHTEWISCLAYIIAHSLTIRSSATSSEDVHLPPNVLQLIRLHQSS
uniref:Ras GTPase-activating protein 1 n=1 Tax=Caenorhabditis tropicalis TaxID=1561998 RepID=A0A1I7UJ13_9PELO